ncbi:MAG TPA: archaemetzincin [Candidatus Angelobacter sp.]|nr:archaemetzincin [Candidatus Angelobacter sp.]
MPLQFSPPKEQSRLDAIGPVDQLSGVFRRLLDPKSFSPMGAPGPIDWLANQQESGQTYREFIRSHPNFPDDKRKVIYLQPLDDFSGHPSKSESHVSDASKGAATSKDGPPLPRLKEFTEAFFALPVRVLPVVHLKGIQNRVNPSTGKIQLLTGDILGALVKMLPADAYCILGITLRDLYPGPQWNYVFGQGTLKERVGVYSFARYDPDFYGQTAPNRASLILRRSCKVLAHETGHIMGVQHCIYYRCMMNGSNHLDEFDNCPMHLCPVDLRKLYVSVGFDPVARYAHLRDFYKEVGFTEDANWIQQQLNHLT